MKLALILLAATAIGTFVWLNVLCNRIIRCCDNIIAICSKYDTPTPGHKEPK